jgi:HEAT repeat protein
VVSLLVAKFPGPTTNEPLKGFAEQPTRASDCGPLLRALALVGAPAAPFVIVRTADADAHVRSWATRLLGELHTLDAAQAVGRRFVDADQDVRRAAVAAARMMQNDPRLQAGIRESLLTLAGDVHSPDLRHAAIEAFAELRDAAAVPDLLLLLSDTVADIVRSAHWALVVITRQDLGLDAARWGAWWRQNMARHRIEWLIDALMHDVPEMRRAAADELKSVSKEYFGYYDDLPPKERARAQQCYREWWDTKGKARFR